jgi:hypothetical protein
MSFADKNIPNIPNPEISTQEFLNRAKEVAILLSVTYILLHNLYELPISQPTKDDQTRPVIHLDSSHTSECNIQEIAYHGANPVYSKEFWRAGNTGHAFMAVESPQGGTEIYGYYPAIFNTKGTDSVDDNNPNDTKLYRELEASEQGISNTIYIQCDDLPKVQNLIKQTMDEMVKYKMNKNFPVPNPAALNTSDGVVGNCVTFLKEFFNSFKLVDEQGNTIPHPLPLYDLPNTYYNLLKLSAEINTGDLVGSGERLLAKFINSLLVKGN